VRSGPDTEEVVMAKTKRGLSGDERAGNLVLDRAGRVRVCDFGVARL
jgi:hypothetical protein